MSSPLPVSTVKALWRAMRPHQWIKNVLVLLPMLAGHRFTLPVLLASGYAFAAFSLAASAGYLVNDACDAASDRDDLEKRHRPIAAGLLTRSTALAVALILAIGAGAIAIAVSANLFLVVVLYLAASCIYTMLLKRVVLLDVFTLAGFYVARILAGGAATGIVLSEWLLGFSLMAFLALALVKRYGELTLCAHNGRSPSANRGYQLADAPLIGAVAAGAGFSAVTVFGIYVTSGPVRELYSRPMILLFAAPVLVFAVCRLLLMAHRGQLKGDPIIAAAADQTSWFCLLGLVAIFAAAY